MLKKIEYVIKNWNENNKIKSEIDVIHVGIYILRATAVIFFTKIWNKKEKNIFLADSFLMCTLVWAILSTLLCYIHIANWILVSLYDQRRYLFQSKPRKQIMILKVLDISKRIVKNDWF